MKWILVKVVATAGGTVLANPDGTVRSLNPSHNAPPFGPYAWQTRPAGTMGGYELVSFGSGCVVYNPLGEPLAFPFVDGVPNTGGMAMMLEEPIKIETVPL